jgi:two-component system, OmpR family, copper resistance phosphate regulon response regulator CusR
LRIADLAVDRFARRATRAGQELILSPKEFELLAYLLQHAGEIVPREMIARDVWQQEHRSTSLDNVIDVHLFRLRKKVDEGFTPRLIHTIRGLGFTLTDSRG